MRSGEPCTGDAAPEADGLACIGPWCASAPAYDGEDLVFAAGDLAKTTSARDLPTPATRLYPISSKCDCI